MQQSGFMELELGDWMDNRMYRVYAVDNNVFSFVDESYNSWPVALVTNPRNGQFIIPAKESVDSILQSTHIRILAWSPDPITSVSVSINGEKLGDATHAEGPLYTLAWTPDRYAEGQHTLEVVITDSQMRKKTVTQPLILDGTMVDFGIKRRFLLMSPKGSELQLMFILAFLATIVPMIVIKMVHVTLEVSTSTGPKGYCCYSLFQKMIRKYKMLASKDSVFWPLLLYHLYVAFGPWFIGEIMEGYIGMVFAFGVLVKNTFLPASTTFIYAFFQIVCYNLPVTLYLAHLLDNGVSGHKKQTTQQFLSGVAGRVCLWFCRHFVFLLLVIFQVYMTKGIYQSYGLLALIFCPVRTWSIPLIFALRWIALDNNYSTVKVEENNTSG